jgi:peptidoglycan/LPS O-acetylase OafA/YrhL
MSAKELPSTDSHRLYGIETLRFVAASLIVVYHTVELPGIPIPSSLNVIRTHYGIGVPLFYTLSGFVLSYGYLDSLQSREQIIKFYLRRFFRIAPLFYAMLGVWIVFSRLRSESFAVGPFEFVLNVSLLFGLVPGRHESIVAAGWSIGIEILFYLLFPIFAALLTSPLTAAATFCVFSVISSLEFNALKSSHMGSFAYMNIITHLPFFLCGILSYLIWRKDGFRARRGLGIVLLFASVATAASIVYVPSVFLFLMSFEVVNVEIYVWALLFAALILSTCFYPNRLLVNRFTRYLGSISFSTYLLHPLLITAFIGVHRRVDAAIGGGAGALAARVALTFGVVTLCSAATHAWIEKPGIALGKKLSARI